MPRVKSKALSDADPSWKPVCKPLLRFIQTKPRTIHELEQFAAGDENLRVSGMFLNAVAWLENRK